MSNRIRDIPWACWVNDPENKRRSLWQATEKCIRLHFRISFACATFLRTVLDGGSLLRELLQPTEDAHPAVAVTLAGFDVAGESGVTDANSSTGANFCGAATLQSVHLLWRKLPTDHGFGQLLVTGIPGVDEQTWRVDLKILASDAELFAVVADAAAEPLASNAHVGFSLGEAIEALLAPPLRGLRRIADRLKDAGRWSGNEDFYFYGIVALHDLSSGHLVPLSIRSSLWDFDCFSRSAQRFRAGLSSAAAPRLESSGS